MSSYQGSVHIRADADAVFGFISQPDSFSKFVPGVEFSDLGEGDAIHFKGTCPHGTYRGVCSFHVDPADRWVRWDSRANLNYRGWMHVVERGDGSDVGLHLEFDPGPEQGTNAEFVDLLKHHPTSVQATIDEALRKLQSWCEISAIGTLSLF